MARKRQRFDIRVNTNYRGTARQAKVGPRKGSKERIKWEEGSGVPSTVGEVTP